MRGRHIIGSDGVLVTGEKRLATRLGGRYWAGRRGDCCRSFFMRGAESRGAMCMTGGTRGEESAGRDTCAAGNDPCDKADDCVGIAFCRAMISGMNCGKWLIGRCALR